MIIGLRRKPGTAAHLTGHREANGKAVSSLPTPPSAQDEVSLTGTPAPKMSLQARVSAMRGKIDAQEAYLEEHEYIPNQVLVRLKNEPGSLSAFSSEYESSVVEEIDLSGLRQSENSSQRLVLLDLKNNLSVAEAMVLMAADPRVSVAESNDVQRAQVTGPAQESGPNDLEDSLWGLHNHGQDGGIAGVDIGAKKAWEATIGSRSGPLVAVIDSGVDIGHQDLSANIYTNPGEIPGDGIDNDGNGAIDDVNGYNTAEDSNDPSDQNGHGTHVAGTIGAVGNNGKGVTGVNQEAQILPVKFLDKEGAGSTAGAIKAIVYASRTGARIVNNSWGGSKYNQLVFDALADSDALFVCAAGNEAYDNDVRPVYPANYELDNIITVTAHDRKNVFPKFANRGETTVELAAPGVDITSTLPRNKYGLLSGTSMATPHVSGAAALIATARPEVTNDELKFLLMNNLETLPEKYGSRIISGGRLNVGSALEQDVTPPGAVTSVKVESATPSHLAISWLATGDDGAEGTASAYDVRYTSGEFQSEDQDPKHGVPFSEGTRLEVSKPKSANSQELLEFEIPPSSRPRHFSVGILAVDNVLNKGQLTTIGVDVPAARVVLEDGAESADDSDFDLGEHWQRVSLDGRGAVFTDSPEGDYPADREAIMVSREFSLKDFRKPVLYFDAKMDVEKKHDEFVVEIEKDGWFGKKWKEVASFDGVSDWKTHKMELSDYAGNKEARIRFRLKSDRDRNRDGVYLDNIVLAEAE